MMDPSLRPMPIETAWFKGHIMVMHKPPGPDGTPFRYLDYLGPKRRLVAATDSLR